MAPPRQGASLALALLLSGIGFWLGEAGGPPLAMLPIAVGIVASLVVALAVAGRRATKATAGAAMIAVYAFAFLGGLASFGRAFNECVERGEEVRVLLAGYHRNHGVYPEALDQLGSPAPCARI